MGGLNISSLIDGKENSLSEQIANHILTKIFKGDLEQGSRLIETNIAKELEVSNIPVREAFYILENTGVIERLPRKGVRVKSISDKEFQDYTDALIELFKIGIDYSVDKWNEEKYSKIKKLLKDANNHLIEEQIFEYVISVHRLCRYVFEVADNIALVKIYNDITFVTNAYSRINWNDIEKTKKRFSYLEDLVDSLSYSNFKKAKADFEKLTRLSLNVE